MSLPTLTRTLDDDFVNTWYEIRAAVIDNVLDATIFWAALNNFGSLVPQVGGEYITRTIGVGEKSTQRFSKGSTLSQSVTNLDSLARWDWRFFLVDVNRTLIDDAKNSGPFKIKDYLTRRLEAARDGLVTDLETYISQWGAYYTGDAQPNGLYDICPQGTAESAQGAGSASDSQASGTSNGNVNRTNNYWKNWYSSDGGSASDTTKIAGETLEPYALNFVADLRHIYNKVNAQQEPPNFILTDQDIYESYEDEALDKLQIVRNGFTRLAQDLGFEALTFKGATMSYSSKLASSLHVFLLNMNYVEMPYHPDVWFDATGWKGTSNQLETVMYIVCMTPGLITSQPRRHGCMEYAS